MSAANVETAVRELLASGLTVQDVADHLRLHVSAVRAALPCTCRSDETTRYESADCPRHVIDTRRRMRGEH